MLIDFPFFGLTGQTARVDIAIDMPPTSKNDNYIDETRLAPGETQVRRVVISVEKRSEKTVARISCRCMRESVHEKMEMEMRRLDASVGAGFSAQCMFNTCSRPDERQDPASYRKYSRHWIPACARTTAKDRKRLA